MNSFSQGLIRFGIAAILVVFAIPAPLCAKDSFLKDLSGDGKYIATSPLRIDSDALPWVAGSAALLGGAFVTDRTVHRQTASRAKSSSALDLKSWGDLAQIAGPVVGVGLWSIGECRGNSYSVDSGRMLLSSVLWTLIADVGLKEAIGRRRPTSTQDDPYLFKPLKSGGGFPSGHTSTTFATAVLLSERYPTWKVIVPAYGIAAATGFSRVYSQQHWTSDVVAGALLGAGISHAIVSRHKRKSKTETQVFFDGRTLQWVCRF